MKIIALAAIVAACTTLPAFAQANPEQQSAPQGAAAPAATQTGAQRVCPGGMAMGGSNDAMMQHMAQMQQMMQTMQQMHTEMQSMQQQMMQMRQSMQPRR